MRRAALVGTVDFNAEHYAKQDIHCTIAVDGGYAQLERAGIKAPSKCRSGECGWCRSRVTSGEVFIPEETDSRRWADKQCGEIHPCTSFALSDITIIVPGEYY